MPNENAVVIGSRFLKLKEGIPTALLQALKQELKMLEGIQRNIVRAHGVSRELMELEKEFYQVQLAQTIELIGVTYNG